MDDKLVLLKLHPCSRNVGEEALREIADAAEIVKYQPGEIVHRASDIVTSVFLVIHGRLRLSLTDLHGTVISQRYQMAGGLFGGLAAALAEPTPVECAAKDPSTLLKLDYTTALDLSAKFPAFRANYARLMALSVKQFVLNDRPPAQPVFVAFFHQSEATRNITREVLSRLVELGETPSVLTDRAVDYAGVNTLQVVGGERDLHRDEAKRKATEWLQHGRVFADVSTGIEIDRSVNTLEKCDQVYWCVTPDNWRDSLNYLQAMLALSPSWKDKVYIVWLLQANELAPIASELRECAVRDVKIAAGELGENQGPTNRHGMERLVHLLRGIQIGVALGGGAARGMAHLGVLKALEENGIVVDMLAGTSAGAMTGTVYSSGLDVDYSVNCFVNDLRPSWFFRCLPHGDQWYLLHKYRRGQFDPMLRKYLGDKRFEQLPVPMHAITVDLISGQTVVRETGDAVHGILESINLPVLSKPINRQGQALVDGGLIDNVPADVLVAKGCNLVIAVSVTAKMEQEFARNHAHTPADNMRTASTLQTLLRSYLVQSHNMNSIGVQPADIVIEPDVTGFDLTQFTRTDELAAIGESTTQGALGDIRKLLHHLDSDLFPAGE